MIVTNTLAALAFAAQAMGLPQGGPINFPAPKIKYEHLQGKLGSYQFGMVTLDPQANMSTLVHEYAHHVQAVNFLPQCEAQAFAAQLAWLKATKTHHPYRQYIEIEAKRSC